MIFRDIEPLTHGTNGALTLTEPSDKSYTLVDDLKVKAINLTHDELAITCITSGEELHIIFKGARDIEFKPKDTYEAYAVHDKSVSLSTIDQVIFDEDLCTENRVIVIVGLGWVLSLSCDEIGIQ